MISTGRGRRAGIGIAVLAAVASGLLVFPGTAAAAPGKTGAPSPTTVSVRTPTASPQPANDEQRPGNANGSHPDKGKDGHPGKGKDGHPGKGHPKPEQPKPEQPKPGHPTPEHPKPGHPGVKDVVSATVTVPDYTGVCPPAEGITATGVITAKHPTPVTYVWVHNGKVVDKGVVKVDGEKTVTFTFTPDQSRTGRVALVMLAPHEIELARDTYTVTCEQQPPAEPPAQATASVTAPAGYTGTCPVNRVFTGTVSVDRVDEGGTTVQYRWAGPDYQGPVETLTFAEGDPLSKQVSHPVEVTETGTIQRWIEILSPNAGASESAEVHVECGPVTVLITNLTRRNDTNGCVPGYSQGITNVATVQVSGGAHVEYEWEVTGTALGSYTVPGSFDTEGPTTQTVSHYIPPGPNALIRVRFRILSPVASSTVVDFTPPPCPRGS